MKFIVHRGFLFVVLGLMVAVAEAQIDSNLPQSDDDPVVAQSAAEILLQYDENADQQFDQQELRTILKSLISQIQELKLEVQNLKRKCELLESQPAKVQIMRKPPLMFPPAGGVYGGKYYPPPAGTNK